MFYEWTTAYDNSRFYGTYTGSVTIGACPPEEMTSTVGSDSSRKAEEYYLYIPATGDSITYSFTDQDGDFVTRTITISGNRITWDEVGECFGVPPPCWEVHLILDFYTDYNNVTVSGTVYDEDPSECQGTVTGSFTRLGVVPAAGGGGGGGGG